MTALSPTALASAAGCHTINSPSDALGGRHLSGIASQFEDLGAEDHVDFGAVGGERQPERAVGPKAAVEDDAALGIDRSLALDELAAAGERDALGLGLGKLLDQP